MSYYLEPWKNLTRDKLASSSSSRVRFDREDELITLITEETNPVSLWTFPGHLFVSSRNSSGSSTFAAFDVRVVKGPMTDACRLSISGEADGKVVDVSRGFSDDRYWITFENGSLQEWRFHGDHDSCDVDDPHAGWTRASSCRCFDAGRSVVVAAGVVSHVLVWIQREVESEGDFGFSFWRLFLPTKREADDDETERTFGSPTLLLDGLPFSRLRTFHDSAVVWIQNHFPSTLGLAFVWTPEATGLRLLNASASGIEDRRIDSLRLREILRSRVSSIPGEDVKILDFFVDRRRRTMMLLTADGWVWSETRDVARWSKTLQLTSVGQTRFLYSIKSASYLAIVCPNSGIEVYDLAANSKLSCDPSRRDVGPLLDEECSFVRGRSPHPIAATRSGLYRLIIRGRRENNFFQSGMSKIVAEMESFVRGADDTSGTTLVEAARRLGETRIKSPLEEELAPDLIRFCETMRDRRHSTIHSKGDGLSVSSYCSMLLRDFVGDEDEKLNSILDKFEFFSLRNPIQVLSSLLKCLEFEEEVSSDKEDDRERDIPPPRLVSSMALQSAQQSGSYGSLLEILVVLLVEHRPALLDPVTGHCTRLFDERGKGEILGKSFSQFVETTIDKMKERP